MSLSKIRTSEEQGNYDLMPECSNPPVKIRLEVQAKIQMIVRGIPVSMTTTENELYMHCSGQSEFINVYNRNNLSELKHVIEIEEDFGISPVTLAACCLSNCVYILTDEGNRHNDKIVRITKDEENQFNISPWISGLPPQNRFMSISANGNLILLSEGKGTDELMSIYNSDGSFQHQIRMSPDIFRVSRIIQKSSGNIVLISYDYEFKRKVTEIDMNGKTVHQFNSALRGCDVESADSSDRILIVGRSSKMELLDSELHLLDVSLPEKSDDLWAHPRFLHYDRLRNEVLMMDYTDHFASHCTLSSFNFTEVRNGMDIYPEQVCAKDRIETPCNAS